MSFLVGGIHQSARKLKHPEHMEAATEDCPEPHLMYHVPHPFVWICLSFL